MRMKLRKEIKLRHLNDARQCKMGLEVDFEDGLGCDMKHEKRHQDDVYVFIIGDVVIIIVTQ